MRIEVSVRSPPVRSAARAGKNYDFYCRRVLFDVLYRISNAPSSRTPRDSTLRHMPHTSPISSAAHATAYTRMM